MPSPYAGVTLENLLPTLGSTLSSVADMPRRALWNLGPALVGRSGQGPQTGAEALERLGLNYDSPTQRAIGAGAGKALDLVADPMNLVGMGMTRRGAAAAVPEAATLTQRLERMAGGGLQGAEQAAAQRAAAPAAYQRQLDAMAEALRAEAPLPRAGTPSPFASTRPPAQAPLPAGRPAAAPTIADAPGLSPEWLQQAPGPRGYPSSPTPLTTERFLQQGTTTTPSATSSLMDRLQRMAPARTTDAY